MRRALPLAVLLLATASTARAQETEEPDPTRLDVERLPPEAIEVTRDLYSHGFFIEAFVGARGFIGGVGRISNPGPYLHLGVGFEITPWLMVAVSAEGSIHRTNAPAPPSPTVFEAIGFFGEARLQANISARAALWLGGEFGIGFSTTDVLVTYGLTQANEVGIAYGGQVGFDWHMRNRHHSFGLAGGARVYDRLAGPDGEFAIGIHGTLYLRYVF